jgi:hypothetical protein
MANTPTKPITKSDEPQEKKADVVLPPKPEGKTETRLFHGADGRVWLTKSEAKSAGFYWNDNG